MNHKVTLNLFDVHPYFKVNFTIYLDYIDKQDGTKFNFPVINKFMFDGNEYLKVTPRGYICIDITSRLDRGESYNRNRFFAMDSKNLFYFISALENLIRVFQDRNIHLYTIDGDTGELILNKELANKYAVKVRVNSAKVIMMIPSVVEQDNIQYEGCCLCINSLDNLTYLTFSEMGYLLYELKKIDIPTLAIHAILVYHLLDESETRELELEKKEPISEEKEEEKDDKIVRIKIEEPHEIPDEL